MGWKTAEIFSLRGYGDDRRKRDSLDSDGAIDAIAMRSTRLEGLIWSSD